MSEISTSHQGGFDRPFYPVDDDTLVDLNYRGYMSENILGLGETLELSPLPTGLEHQDDSHIALAPQPPPVQAPAPVQPPASCATAQPADHEHSWMDDEPLGDFDYPPAVHEHIPEMDEWAVVLKDATGKKKICQLPNLGTRLWYLVLKEECLGAPTLEDYIKLFLAKKEFILKGQKVVSADEKVLFYIKRDKAHQNDQGVGHKKKGKIKWVDDWNDLCKRKDKNGVYEVLVLANDNCVISDIPQAKKHNMKGGLRGGGKGGGDGDGDNSDDDDDDDDDDEDSGGGENASGDVVGMMPDEASEATCTTASLTDSNSNSDSEVSNMLNRMGTVGNDLREGIILSDQCLMKVLFFADLTDLMNSSQVCRGWHHASNRVLAQRLQRQDCGTDSTRAPPEATEVTSRLTKISIVASKKDQVKVSVESPAPIFSVGEKLLSSRDMFIDTKDDKERKTDAAKTTKPAILPAPRSRPTKHSAPTCTETCSGDELVGMVVGMTRKLSDAGFKPQSSSCKIRNRYLRELGILPGAPNEATKEHRKIQLLPPILHRRIRRVSPKSLPWLTNLRLALRDNLRRRCCGGHTSGWLAASIPSFPSWVAQGRLSSRQSNEPSVPRVTSRKLSSASSRKQALAN